MFRAKVRAGQRPVHVPAVTTETAKSKRDKQPAASATGDPYLLTPGPLTTSVQVKQAMLHDCGSRDEKFIELTRSIRERLLDIVDGRDTHVCVPIQGSGTYAVEAMLASLLPRDGRLLNLVNGAYGRRITRICEYLGRPVVVSGTPEDQPLDVRKVDELLIAQPTISHVAMVHCETTSGILNPVHAIAEVVTRHGKGLLLDAMSAFGALRLSVKEIPLESLAASVNKCLEGVPGMSFCIARRSALERCAGNAHSLSLDLYDQWRALEGSGQWRFTPPTHCVLALAQALNEFDAEGGSAARLRRYADNCRILISGMRALGFRPFLPDACQAPIIVTFHCPADPAFVFPAFYEGLRARGYVIYPGKLTGVETFRIGCIGRVGKEEMHGLLGAVRETLAQLGVMSCAPRVA